MAGFVENHQTIHFSLANLFLFAFGHLKYFLALRAATAVELTGTFFTLNKKQVTPVIAAIDMGIGWLPALVTPGNDFIAHALAQPVIKDKILPMKLVFQAMGPHGTGIINKTAFQMVDIFKPLM